MEVILGVAGFGFVLGTYVAIFVLVPRRDAREKRERRWYKASATRWSEEEAKHNEPPCSGPGIR